MKELPKLLYAISTNELLNSAVFSHILKQKLLPSNKKLGFTYQIEDMRIDGISLNKINLFVSEHIKSCVLQFELESVNFYEEADNYFLNEKYLKEEVWLGNFKRSKQYVYILNEILIEVSVSRSGRNKDGLVRLSSQSIKPSCKIYNDFEIKGDLIYEDSQNFKIGSVQNREATSEEIEYLNLNRNSKLSLKIQRLKNQIDKEIHGLESFQFYDSQGIITNIYLSKNLKNELIRNGLSIGKNSLSIKANLKRYNDFSVIIEDIITFKIENK